MQKHEKNKNIKKKRKKFTIVWEKKSRARSPLIQGGKKVIIQSRSSFFLFRSFLTFVLRRKTSRQTNKTIIGSLSNMALRHLWIVSVALLSVSCRSGNRASPESPLVLTRRCRTTRNRSTCWGSSVYRWKPLPTLHDRMAWMSTLDQCRWTPAADGKWTNCSLRALQLACQPLERQLELVQGLREATWWMAFRIVVMKRLTMVLWV